MIYKKIDIVPAGLVVIRPIPAFFGFCEHVGNAFFAKLFAQIPITRHINLHKIGKTIVTGFDKMSNAIMACAKIKWDAACKNLPRSKDNV